MEKIKPIEFINLLRESDRYIKHIYTMGSCYQFYVMLKRLYPEAEALINEDKNHVVTEIESVLYDINGVVEEGNPEHFDYMTDEEIKDAKGWAFHKHQVFTTVCTECREDIEYVGLYELNESNKVFQTN